MHTTHRMKTPPPDGSPRCIIRPGANAAAFAATFVLAFAPPAWPEIGRGGGDLFANLQTVSDEELSHERGKFITPNGLDVGFGATIKTEVNGQVALETHLSLTNNGVQIAQSGPAANSRHFAIPAGPVNVNTATTQATGDASSTQTISQTGPGSETTVTVTGFNADSGGQIQTAVNNATGGNTTVNVSGFSGGGQGVVVTDPRGGTAVAFGSVNPTNTVNAIVNNASGLAITQQVQVTMTIDNFSSFQHSLSQGQIAASVLNAVQGGLLQSVIH